MIELNFVLLNPWANSKFDNLFNRTKAVSKNKAIEFEICRWTKELAALKIDTNWRGMDHAGPSIEIGLLGYSITLKLYDIRHWDYSNNSWQKYNTDI